MKEKINVACASDDNYAQHLGVLVYSLLDNSSNPKEINIYIIDAGIKEQNKERLLNTSKKFKSNMFFIKPKMKMEDLNVVGHVSTATYYRLVIPDLVKVDRIIYLDSDLIVLGDVKELYSLSQENIVGAVRELHRSNYLNSGVMLIDCKLWRKNSVSKRLSSFLKENPEKINFKCPDQDILNHVLSKEWFDLPYEWNVSPFYYGNKHLINKVGKEKYKSIIKRPKIVHYVWPSKPWSYSFFHKSGRYYWAYLEKTPWRDSEFKDKNLKNFLIRLAFLISSPISINTKVKIKSIIGRLKTKWT